MKKSERIADLQADRALHELDTRDGAELERLTGGQRDASYEVAAAAVALAFSCRSTAPKLPARVVRRVLADAEASFRNPTARTGGREEKSTTAAGAQVIVMPSAPHPRDSHVDYVRWGGWISAAACLVIVATQALSPRGDVRAAGHGGGEGPSAALVPGEDQAGSGAAGRISWNAEEQRGELTVHGLATSAPKEEYEAWLIDSAREGNVAVPLGHFAVPTKSSTPVSIEVRSPVRVRRGTRFLVTVEPAGGVLLPSRSRVALEGDLDTR